MKITRKQLRQIISEELDFLQDAGDLTPEEEEALQGYFEREPPSEDSIDEPMDPLIVSALSKLGVVSQESGEAARAGDDISLRDLATAGTAGMSLGNLGGELGGLASSIEDVADTLDDESRSGDVKPDEKKTKKTKHSGPKIKGMHRYFLSGIMAAQHPEGDPDFEHSRFNITDTQDGEQFVIHGREFPVTLHADRQGDRAIEIYDIILPPGDHGQAKLRARYKGKEFDLKTNISERRETMKITKKQLRSIINEELKRSASVTPDRKINEAIDILGIKAIVDEANQENLRLLNEILQRVNDLVGDVSDLAPSIPDIMPDI
jgi:hypothetical protein